jgi:hypothetical protein
VIAVLERAVFAGSILKLDALIDADRSGPATVSLRAYDAPDCSSRRQIGSLLFALVSVARPMEISFFETFCDALPFSVSGATRQRSLRWAAALSRTSCVSVSLMDMDEPLASLIGGQADPGPSLTRAPDRLDRRG